MATLNQELFDDLINQLRAYEYWEDADFILSLKRTMWTSSSEMMGELGLAVLTIQSQNRDIPDELSQALALCMKEVRKVWPGIKLAP